MSQGRRVVLKSLIGSMFLSWHSIGLADECTDWCECAPCELTLKSLVRMEREQLECLYRGLAIDALPCCGYYAGRMIYKAGSVATVPTAGATRFLWQGKYIDPVKGIMLNKVMGGKAVPAAMFLGESWLDGQPSVIMDYAPFGGKLSSRARDEIRLVRPGLYLGCMYVRDKCGRRLWTYFAIEHRGCTPCEPSCLADGCR